MDTTDDFGKEFFHAGCCGASRINLAVCPLRHGHADRGSVGRGGRLPGAFGGHLPHSPRAGQFARRVGRRLSGRGDDASGLWGSGGRAPRQSGVAAAVGSGSPRQRTAPGTRSQWTRAIHRSAPCSGATSPNSITRNADVSIGSATDRFPARHRGSCDRRPFDMRQGATPGHLFGQRCRKEHALGTDGEGQLGRH